MSSRIRVLRPKAPAPGAPGLPGPRKHLLPFSVHRAQTIALLRRYFRLSIELGRLPCFLGREFFRSNVTSCRMQSFEDAVILVYDIERCLLKLDQDSQQLIARIVLQDYTQEETAKLLGWRLRRVERRFPKALDSLAEVLIRAKLLSPYPQSSPRRSRSTTELSLSEAEVRPPKKPVAGLSCQSVEIRKIAVNDLIQGR